MLFWRILVLCCCSSFRQVTHSLGQALFSNCDDNDVNCGTNKNPTGVCYPLSVTPTVSAVNREIRKLKDASGKPINANNEVATVMGWVGGIGVGVILIGFSCYYMYNKINSKSKS